MPDDEINMSVLRAQILACYCSPAPNNIADLTDRAINIEKAARSILHIDFEAKEENLPAHKLAALGQKRSEMEAECDLLVKEGWLSRPHPHAQTHHKAPKGVYTITRNGALMAYAVFQRSREGQAKGIPAVG